LSTFSAICFWLFMSATIDSRSDTTVRSAISRSENPLGRPVT
jgi:hypothetical protein